jgi:hypothetical protein
MKGLARTPGLFFFGCWLDMLATRERFAVVDQRGWTGPKRDATILERSMDWYSYV